MNVSNSDDSSLIIEKDRIHIVNDLKAGDEDPLVPNCKFEAQGYAANYELSEDGNRFTKYFVFNGERISELEYRKSTKEEMEIFREEKY